MIYTLIDWLLRFGARFSGTPVGAPGWQRHAAGFLFLFMLLGTVFVVLPFAVWYWGYVVWFLGSPDVHGSYVISTGIYGMPCSK